MKRCDAGFGRLEERVGAEISLQLGTRRRMAESGDGGMGHELAPLRSEACTPESAPDRLGKRDEVGLWRGADPQHARCAARWKTPEAAQFETKRRCRDTAQCGLDPALHRFIDLADEGEGQMEGISLQPTGASQSRLQPTNGLPQPNGQRECDKQTWHGSFLRPVTAYRPSVRLHPRPSRFLDRIPKSGLGSYAILQRQIDGAGEPHSAACPGSPGGCRAAQFVTARARQSFRVFAACHTTA